MSGRTVIPISAHPPIGKITEARYFRLYEESLADPDGFWGREGKRIDWIKPYTKVKNASFEGDVSIKWFEDGTLNASYNCIDRHLADSAATRPRSCGRATTRPRTARSPTASCTRRCAGSPMC